jgi:photosystem II stability/assembly factor-like uncharacterized protein
MLGVGAILHRLGGGSENSGDKYYGRKITTAELKNDELHMSFDDGVSIRVFDDGQSCCESRHMSTSDDVSWLVGKTLTGLSLKEAPDVPDEWGEHEVQFLEVMTDQGCITFANHNEHNGYYGGFGMTIKEIQPRDSETK